jgi:hypothetical protein
VPDTPNHSAAPSADVLEDSLAELLGDAVVYETGEAPPQAETVAVFEPTDVEVARPGYVAAESRVSPVFWAAAVVWNLPGGIGSWLLLRKTHPKTARRLLVLGIVSFAIIASVITAVVLTQRALNPSIIYLRR